MRRFPLFRILAALETFGGQACLLFVLYYSTLAGSAFHVRNDDLTKQAFAAILGFLTGHTLGRGPAHEPNSSEQNSE